MFGAHIQIAVVATVSAVLATQAFVRLHPREPQAPPAVQAAVKSPQPARSAPIAAAPPRAAQGEYRIAADPQGQFAANVEVDGQRIHMLVDTGASAVALSYEDASAAGIYPFPADYKYSVSTANGTARVARVTLRNVRVGPLVVQDVDAFVGERGALGSSLLGMTFLSKLSHIEVASGALVLRQ